MMNSKYEGYEKYKGDGDIGSICVRTKNENKIRQEGQIRKREIQ